MKQARLYMLMLLALIVAGCSALEPNIEEYQGSVPLGQDEGYVLFGAASSNPSLKFEFSSGLNSYITPVYPSGLQHRMLILPEGTYQLSSLYAGAAQFLPSKASRWQGWKFTVQPGKINYFGIMSLDGNSFRRTGSLAAAHAVVKSEYPQLAGQYEIVEAAK